ncbi:MAG TPA: BLUF domain-containing protein [Caldimonas sp.]|nr:BLUF domain-containing protein [Caldimonas sp.]
MPAVFQLFYVSRATAVLDGAQVQSILQAARRDNARLDVTGCLLFSGHCFAQVLEGARPVVAALAQRIAADPRHVGLRVLSQTEREEREYADWAMGYLYDLNLEDDLETLLMIPDRSPAVIADVTERMRPDPVMGALR